jgi:hypothetical protein
MSPDEKNRKRKFKKREAFAQFEHQPGHAMTRPVFCQRNPMSESTYYKLKRLGKAPREIEIGDRVIITEEAEAEWRREREAETAAKRAAEQARAPPPNVA